MFYLFDMFSAQTGDGLDSVNMIGIVVRANYVQSKREQTTTTTTTIIIIAAAATTTITTTTTTTTTATATAAAAAAAAAATATTTTTTFEVQFNSVSQTKSFPLPFREIWSHRVLWLMFLL